MVKLIENVLKERNLKEVKYFKIYDSYRHVYNKPLLTTKFYSKHEGDFEDLNMEIMNRIRLNYLEGPKEKYKKPVTSNQEYGWYPRFSEHDPRFGFPRVIDKTTEVMLELRRQTKNEPKFTGVPFLLQ